MAKKITRRSFVRKSVNTSLSIGAIIEQRQVFEKMIRNAQAK